MKPREDCICDSLGEFVEVESTGRMSRHLVPPASHPASRDFLCRFVLPSQHLSASNFPDPPTNGSRSAEPFTGQRGGSGSKPAQDLKRGWVFLVVLPNSLKAFFNKQHDFIAPGVGRTASMSGRCGGPSFALWPHRPQ